jgi:hypothetical protein
VATTFRALDDSSVFPVIEPTLIPISDGLQGGETRPPSIADQHGLAPQPGSSETRAPSATTDGGTLIAPRPRRVKRRAK